MTYSAVVVAAVASAAVGGGVPPGAPVDAAVLIVLVGPPVVAARRGRREARSAPQRAHVAEHEAALGPGGLGGTGAPRGAHGTPLAAQSSQGTPAGTERVERRGGGQRSHYGCRRRGTEEKRRFLRAALARRRAVRGCPGAPTTCTGRARAGDHRTGGVPRFRGDTWERCHRCIAQFPHVG